MPTLIATHTFISVTSSLELASKNIVCGSVKMVYALIYTLFLGFGLQIGSDLYLLVDRNARDDLTTAGSSSVQNAFTLSGKYWTDNSTVMGNNTHFFHLDGPTSFTFTNVNPIQHDNIVVGCYRPPSFPWYLKPFPWWTQFIIVPVFSLCSSLGNLQPLFSIDLIVMILISCTSYTANKVANHYIFERSDVVSAIGAFVVGVLGNVYSRKMGGTAFTVMVTGVLFLVPVSFATFPFGSCILTYYFYMTVRPVPSWRHHCAGRRYRDWERHGGCYHRHHRRAVHESSHGLHVRIQEECCHLLVLGNHSHMVL